ncbi:hypothetical protein [Acetobacter orientalis]|uniref:hypothetical protein n=1 Tax=Acetobacter orientalis TaxID=146474 RepID=UPI001177BC8B|nr:hypothetical protein [Acetobacter orientalis]
MSIAKGKEDRTLWAISLRSGKNKVSGLPDRGKLPIARKVDVSNFEDTAKHTTMQPAIEFNRKSKFNLYH